MPTYIFKNMTTGEEFEKFMSMSEKETYLKQHATVAQLPNAINVVGIMSWELDLKMTVGSMSV